MSLNDFIHAKKPVGEQSQYFFIKFAEEICLKELNHIKISVTVKNLVIDD